MPNDVAASIKEAVTSTLKETRFKADDDARVDARDEADVDPASKVIGDDTPKEDKEEVVAEEVVKSDQESVVEDKKPLVEKVEEENFRPTAEELAVIDQSPELKKVYRSMVKGFTEKTGNLATKRKEAERAMLVIKTLQENPHQTIRALASAAGLRIAEEVIEGPPATVEKSIVERLQERLEAKIGKEGAEVLAPVLLDAIGVVSDEKLVPIQAALKEQAESGQMRALRSSISEFGTKIVEDGGEWGPEIEADMAKLVGRILPGEGMTLPDFLEVLHNNVTVARDRRGVKEREVTRIQKAAKGKEPVRPARPTAVAPASIVPGMNMKEATALAVAAARQEAAGR